MTIEVKNLTELKTAINSNEKEIISYDPDVISKLKAVNRIKKYSPYGVGILTAAIATMAASPTLGPAGIFTGALSFVGAKAILTSSGVATSTIIALVVAIGGIIAINLFTDWDYVEIPGGMKMKRRK